MVRTTLDKINVVNHVASFKCDKCQTLQENVNVNTGLEYCDGTELIKVPCTGCGCISYYPKTGNEVSQKLHQAKTE